MWVKDLLDVAGKELRKTVSDVGVLVFFGTMVTHDYSLIKNLITILGTIVAMAFIIFIVLLFSMLLAKLVSLVTNLITEIQYRA